MALIECHALVGSRMRICKNYVLADTNTNVVEKQSDGLPCVVYQMGKMFFLLWLKEII